MQVKYVILS